MPRAILVAALAFRLLLDMATPLMPGAFHFNVADSIEAHRTQPVGSGAQSVSRSTALPRIVAENLVTPPPEIRLQATPMARWPLFHSVLSRQAPDRGPEGPDDH